MKMVKIWGEDRRMSWQSHNNQNQNDKCFAEAEPLTAFWSSSDGNTTTQTADNFQVAALRLTFIVLDNVFANRWQRRFPAHTHTLVSPLSIHRRTRRGEFDFTLGKIVKNVLNIDFELIVCVQPVRLLQMTVHLQMEHNRNLVLNITDRSLHDTVLVWQKYDLVWSMRFEVKYKTYQRT